MSNRRQFVRSLKNITNGYSSVEIQVRNATSNDSWGPATKELHELSLLTYHDRYVYEILGVLEKRLNDKGKQWRHVMKALSLFLYFVYEGSETVLKWLKDHLHLVKTLREFTYADRRNIDQGAQIRSKSRVLTELIENPKKLKSEKENYRRIRLQMSQPGIVELGGETAAARRSSRMTLDLGSHNGNAIRSAGFSGAYSPVSTSNSSGLQGPDRRSGSSRPYDDGRYSLSLLQIIDEEDYTADLARITSSSSRQLAT